ncbi:GAF domain-containing protein [Lyngbya aestuarii]|uniref:GAF domain-containing protein n=1 Tax=Lyngbya aestuarii TaxID=118322 RepID=UPI00403DAFAE
MNHNKLYQNGQNCSQEKTKCNHKSNQRETCNYLKSNREDIRLIKEVQDNIPCIYFTLAETGVVLSVSEFGAAYLGYEVNQLCQQPVRSLFDRKDQNSCQIQLSLLQQQPTQISQWEARLIGKQGNQIWVKATACLVPGTETNPLINLVCEDITAAKQMEQTLRESEELHRNTLSNISDTVFITNYLGKFTFICPNVDIIFGYSLPEVQEMGNIAQLLGESFFDWQELAIRGEIPNIEREITDKTGKTHTLLVNVKRVAIKEGTVLYSCRDITERHQAEQELSQYRHHLECRVAQRTAELTRANQQLQEEISKRQQAEEAFQQQFLRKQLVGSIARRIHQSLNLEVILNTTVIEVRQFLACDRVVIFRLDTDGSGVVVVESVNSEFRPIAGTPINDRYFAESYIELYQQGRVQAIEDVYAAGLTKCHVDLLTQFQVKANLVVPIVHEQQLWGLLVAQQCQETRQWQEWEIELLKNLSTQTAIAIQQSELYQQAQSEIVQRQQAEAELRQMLVKEKLIGAITQRIRQSLNLDEILERTVVEVRQVLQTDRVIIFCFEPDWSGTVVVESVNQDWPSIRGNNIHDHCFEEAYVLPYQQGRVGIIEDIRTANISDCHKDLLERFQVRANLVVPIVKREQSIHNLEANSQNQLWGLLIAHHCGEPRQWQQFEVDLFCSLASQAAIAIQQSQLYEQAKSQAQREQAFNQVTQAIRSSLDLNTIFSTAVQQIGELLQLDRALIVQYLPEKRRWLHVSEYAKNPDSPKALGREIPDQNNPIAEKIKRLEIVKINDSNTCEDEINRELAQTFPGSWLLVPLHFGSQVWGSITLGRDTHPYHWQESEVELVRALVDQIAIAIQQSQLYEQAQHQAKREQIINQLIQSIRCSLDLPTIFSTATHEIEKVLPVDRAQIVQFLPEERLWVNVAESCKKTSPVGLGVEIPDQNNPIAEKLKRLEVVKIDDTNLLEDKTNKSFARNFPGAWLLVPLHFDSSVWGALCLVMDVGPYHWQDSEVELICKVADQLAIALQQAQLYEQTRIAAKRSSLQAQQLKHTLQKLQKAQAQLVQGEKMSSLGQLVAGVAHEINNPVNFIYANLTYASEYTQDMLSLIELYQQTYPTPQPEVQSKIETIELGFLMEDLPKILDSMKVGAERICEIVRSLRNFSRCSEGEMKGVDIHEGLDSTLMILQSRLRANGKHHEIYVTKEYGDLPLVECYAGQINQVFMNLLVNAIDAIDDYNRTLTLDQIKANPGEIRVRTEVLPNQQVAICICDNGPGMPEQVKERIFDPFFTTKAVGTGTGLGLSISYQIVFEQHKGQLHCQSEPGQGTEFLIQIPIKQLS